MTAEQMNTSEQHELSQTIHQAIALFANSPEPPTITQMHQLLTDEFGEEAVQQYLNNQKTPST